MADTTALAETAQAVFCAVADKLGASKAYKALVEDASTQKGKGFKFENFEDFLQRDFPTIPKMTGEQLLQDAWEKRTTTPGVTLDQVKKFLDKQPTWYKSSCLVAAELVSNLSKKVDPDFKISPAGYNNIFYFRTDPKVMNAIDNLWKLANTNGIGKIKGQIAFKDINKWSPADIYLATNKCEREIAKFTKKYEKTQCLSFPVLNKFIRQQIDSGDLLPLSLKKVASGVNLYRVNFVRKIEEEMIANVSSRFIGTNSSTKYRKYTINNPSALQLQIHLNGVPGMHVLKHDVTNNGWKSEYVPGSSARGGAVSGNNEVPKIFGLVDKQFGDKLAQEIKMTANKFRATLKDPNYKPHNPRPYSRKGERVGPGGLAAYRNESDFKKSNPTRAWRAEWRDWFVEERKHISAIHVANPVFSSINTFLSNKENADMYARTLFEVATSRSPLSAAFVIAK